MKLVILAAGRGSRMKKATEKSHKALSVIDGSTLFDRILQNAKSAGITEIAAVTGYKHEMFDGFDVTKFYNDRWQTSNMVTSLECATEWLEGSEFIVSYSDILYQVQTLKTLMDSKGEISITYDPNWITKWSLRFTDPSSDAETFKVNNDNELIEIGNQISDVSAVEGQYMGLLKFSPFGWAKVKEIRDCLQIKEANEMDMTTLLKTIIEQNKTKIKALPIYDDWWEIDTKTDLIIANNR